MKEKILEALKTRFVGIDEKFLEKRAAKMAKTITDETAIDDAVSGIKLQELLDSYKDSYVTEAVKTAIGNYETKYNLKDGKPVEKPIEPQPQPNQTIDLSSITDPNIRALVQAQQAQAAAQAEQIKNLTTLVTGMQTKNVNETRMAKLTELLKEAPEALQKQYTADFERMASSFKDDADFDGWYEGTRTTLDTLAQATRAAGGIFTPPAPRQQQNQQPQVNAYVQQRAQAREAFYNQSGGAIQGLPQAPAAAPSK